MGDAYSAAAGKGCQPKAGETDCENTLSYFEGKLSRMRGHVQMTSVLRGEGGESLSDDRRERLRDLYTINSDRGRGSKIPKIRLTSFVHGP